MPEPNEPTHGEPRTELRWSYPSIELRIEGEGEARRPRLVGHFARFGEWSRIDSTEGAFMERIAPGAFARTLKNNRDRIRVLFQHGRDATLGDKPIAAITELREDDQGAYYEAELLDGLPEIVLAGLRANQYGASFRFSVPQDKDDWVHTPKASPSNPAALPERTIREAKVFEFGPVTFPAYAGATAGVRSFTLSDLDAAPEPPEQTPALPDAGPEAEPHSDEGTREVVTPTIDPEPEKESPAVEYVTIDEKRARDREITDELTRTSNEFTGVLPDAEQVRWDGLVSEQDKLRADIAAWESRQARLEAAAQKPQNVVPTYTPIASFARKSETDIFDLEGYGGYNWEQRNQKFYDNAMRAVDGMRFSHPNADQARAKEDLQALLDYKDTRDKEVARRILTTGSPLYRRFFSKYVAQQPMSPEEQRAPLAVTADGTGGYAVPAMIDPTLIHTGAFTNVNAFRSICRIEKIVGTDTWQAVTAGAVTAAYTTEAAVTADSAPTLTSPSYETHRATCLVAYSIEIDQDWANLGTEMASLIGEAKDTLEEAQFTVGTGATVYPHGVLSPHATPSYTSFHTASVDVCVAADLYSAEAALPIRYRRNAVWMGSRVWIRAMQALETTGGPLFDGGQYAKTGPIANRANGDTGLTLLGYPVFEAPSADTAITTTNTHAAVLFDPKTYIIVDRVGMNVEVIPHLFDGSTPSVPYGRRGLYALWRNTARPVVVDGGRTIDIQ